MLSWTLTVRRTLMVVVAVTLADAAVSSIPAWNTSASSYIFQLLSTGIGLCATIWRAVRTPRQFRGQWWLFSAGIGLWFLGSVFSAWEDLFQRLPFEIASLSDFSFFFYGIPILLALSAPAEGQRFRAFAWLDGLQAVFAGYLTYITIFSVLPFSPQAGQPISIPLLVVTYNIENSILTAVCLLRLIASVRGGEERQFYRILGVFCLANEVGVAVYNYIEVGSANHFAPDLLVNVPLLLLALMIAAAPAKSLPAGSTTPRKTRLALLIDLVSPMFFTLALLTLGFLVLRQHFLTGSLAIAVALVAYGLRSSLLQMSYIQIQDQLREARDRLEGLSLQDGLTGVANRRSFDRTLEAELRRASRTGNPLSLLLLDLDFFKSVNDRFGHLAGDRSLVDVAAALKAEASRSGDLVARYGGEEFAIILPVTKLEAAQEMAESIRKAVLALRIPNSTEIGTYLTVSIGVVTVDFSAESEQSDSPQQLVAAADRALYRAKLMGRNRVVAHGSADLL